ncbi:zinc-finger homeodomain protein 5-like [Sesamum indicum]|uniref:Zinc-finger homeodomain protein 5-like n=1 Tax=Sesamum indicum TaxID=4182 RepID=A0A6I9SVE9_SESIN|nr:zinc-finger homeodomain protein 5-like [Sesamum indicum]
MSLSTGEEKGMRTQTSSAAYNHSLLENPISRQEKTRLLDPDCGGSISRPTNPRTIYRECLKNHAANIGGNVTDGCGEFMPSGDEGTLEALKCAACNCHRNFHRKEHHGGAAMVHPLHLPPPLPSASLAQHHVRGGLAHWAGSMVQPVKMAFCGGGGGSIGTDSSSEELNFNAFHSHAVAPPPPVQFGNKKRFRTKFTAEQKEKMMGFAEKLGWRIPREDDTELQRFCAEIGVKRQVFKVWMHNNKTSSKKTPQELQI